MENKDKKNNSSNSLVFGRWPQTKMTLSRVSTSIKIIIALPSMGEQSKNARFGKIGQNKGILISTTFSVRPLLLWSRCSQVSHQTRRRHLELLLFWVTYYDSRWAQSFAQLQVQIFWDRVPFLYRVPFFSITLMNANTYLEWTLLRFWFYRRNLKSLQAIIPGT